VDLFTAIHPDLLTLGNTPLSTGMDLSRNLTWGLLS